MTDEQIQAAKDLRQLRQKGLMQNSIQTPDGYKTFLQTKLNNQDLLDEFVVSIL